VSYNGDRLQPIEWIGSILWTIFWGTLGYIAISERSITLGGRLGISHTQGLAAVLLGFLLLGASLIGVGWLLRLHPFERLLKMLLFVGWLCSAIVYFVFFYH
jgi:hypothetical protein